MGSSVSAYYDDINEYLDLCQKYGVSPEVDLDGRADPYSDHCMQLKKKYREDKPFFDFCKGNK